MVPQATQVCDSFNAVFNRLTQFQSAGPARLDSEVAEGAFLECTGEGPCDSVWSDVEFPV